MKKLFRSFIIAISMFTIIKTPNVEWDEDGNKYIMTLYPLVGLIVGFLWALLYIGIHLMNTTEVLESVIMMVFPFIITGFIHLDGFTDVCDAILSRREKEEKLKILKDSMIGAFGCIALIILFFVNFGALYSIFLKYNTVYYSFLNIGKLFGIGSPFYAFLFIPVISRSLAAFYLMREKTIKESSLGAYFKKETGINELLIMLSYISFSVMFMAFFIGYKSIVITLFMYYFCSVSVRRCISNFGGVSGDVAGFSLVIAETVGLLTFALL
ncbi:adenosylcobinamide-GDP ribazoletransferase [Clostridium sp. BJN0001]|uniref:adenosylcobinamide-GDP ribazoletransferase n=1 Tax=Clostridium sp. BJN0001 TaxID=2930219 RepID=UPI001FD5E79D|nr:adenosylcobinamide-GDP ribazoletransferase [Clostridium sp. BJN0001]